MHQFTRHLTHYTSLLGVLGAALLGLLIFSYDQYFQSAIAISSGVAYVVWGIAHHHVHEELHHKVVFEYIATAVLGVVVLLALIWNA